MIIRKHPLAALLLITSLIFLGPAVALADLDKTLSPYFEVKSDDPNTDRLPLHSTSAEVNIAGVIADVTVTQVYKNEGKNALEAIYVFPASSKAAVYGMKMIIGTRTVTAEIRERGQARREYEQAKASGQRASLLEQQRPNVFQMNVANIMPGDVVKVILSYTELLVPNAGVYEFVYPTVVGPRYSNQPVATATEADQYVASPYQKSGLLPSYQFDIDVHLAAGLPVHEVKSTSHKVNVAFKQLKSVDVGLDKSEQQGGNRDYVLQYRLAGDEIESGLLLYEHNNEKFFLLMVQPPKKVEAKRIPPREYVFIVDVSGSMRGFPIDISKRLLRDLIVGLKPTDMFNVMLFAGTSGVLSETSLPATPENISMALNHIDNQRGGGGTNLLPAMQRALKLPRTEGLSRSMVIVTDGYVHVEKEAFDLIRNNLDRSNLFAFGIGPAVNRYIIDGMARVGKGEPAVITENAGAHAQADKFRQYIQSPVLTQVKSDFGDFEVYDTEPTSIPDVLAERPIIIFGKYRGEPKGKITVKGWSGRERFKTTFDVAEACADTRNGALRYLWARERIQLLDDYNRLSMEDERVKEVTQLGLDYNLMTAYTSFIAVDREKVNNRDLVSVKQALPLPQNVANSAVGFDFSISKIVRRGVKAAPCTLVAGPVKCSAGNKMDTNIQAWVESNLQAFLAQNKTTQAEAKKKGSAILHIILDSCGEVVEVKIISGALHPDLADRLIAAIRQWRYDGLNAAGTVSFHLPISLAK